MWNIKNTNNKSKSKKGFSLVEMLITVFVSTLIILSVVATFAGVMRSRKKARDIQQNMENARSAMDLMAKTIRMSSKVSTNPSNPIVVYMYNNSTGQCVSFIRRSGVGQIEMGTQRALSITDKSDSKYRNCRPGVVGDYDYSPITSLNENSKPVLLFEVTQSDVNSTLSIIGKATILVSLNDINLQTSVSFRDYGDFDL